MSEHSEHREQILSPEEKVSRAIQMIQVISERADAGLHGGQEDWLKALQDIKQTTNDMREILEKK